MSRNAKAWAALLVGFPSFNPTVKVQAAWDLLMSDQTPEALLAGAIEYARVARYPTPTIGEWLEHARHCDPARPLRLTVAEAWDEMYQNRRARHRGPVTWSSDAVMRAAQAIGWDDPLWETDQLPTLRAQFRDFYTSLADKTERVDESHTVRRIAAGLPNLAQLYGPGYRDDAP